MAGEDLLEGADGGTNDDTGKKGKKHKPLSKGQKIGVGIGVITILLVIVQIERSKSSASSSTTAAANTTPIDPQTGYPEGSAEDQAALAQLSAGMDTSSSGISGDDTTDDGIDPSTGSSYSSEISNLGSELSTLGTDYTALETQWSSLSSNPGPPYRTTPWQHAPTPVTTKTPTSVQSANLANLQSELTKDEKGNTAGDKASVVTLKKQISAVQARS